MQKLNLNPSSLRLILFILLMSVGPLNALESADTNLMFEEQPVACPAQAPRSTMVVKVNNEKPEQYKRYADALQDSKLYERLGGYFQVLGRPESIIEGEWLDYQYMVVARFPCIERAQQFWASSVYAEIKKMREGAGAVTVTLYNDLPIPERIDWVD